MTVSVTGRPQSTVRPPFSSHTLDPPLGTTQLLPKCPECRPAPPAGCRDRRAGLQGGGGHFRSSWTCRPWSRASCSLAWDCGLLTPPGRGSVKGAGAWDGAGRGSGCRGPARGAPARLPLPPALVAAACCTPHGPPSVPTFRSWLWPPGAAPEGTVQKRPGAGAAGVREMLSEC